MVSSPIMPLSLPLIDLSSYYTRNSYTDNDRLAASQDIHNACRDFGFFYLKLDGFATEEEMAGLAKLARDFFHLDQAKKDEIRLANEDGARGEPRGVLGTQATIVYPYRFNTEV